MMIPHLFTHALHAFRASREACHVRVYILPLFPFLDGDWRGENLSAPQNNGAISKQKQTTALRREWGRVFWVNLRLRTYVKKAYVRIVKMHPKIDRPQPMHVIIDSGSLCSSLGWRKSKHSIVEISVDVTKNLTDLSILSNYHQANVRRRRNLTSVSTPKQRRNPCIRLPAIQYNTNFIVNSPWGLFRDKY